MDAVAQRGRTILVRTEGSGSGTARVVNPDAGEIGPEMYEPSIVAWGYWGDVSDPELAGRALELADATTAAAWDESKHPRESAGRREGGRFRSTQPADSPSSPVDESKILPWIRDDVEGLRSIVARETLDEAEQDRIIDGYEQQMIDRYHEEYDAGARTIAERLAGMPATVTASPPDDNMALADPERHPGGRFIVSLPDDPGASFTVFTETDGSLSEWQDGVGDVLDPTDTDFFPADDTTGKVGRYVGMLRAVRGDVITGDTTLYRGMSGAERAAWDAGDAIPVGKFFTSEPTANMAQDIAGEFPELHEFTVAKNDVVETDPGVYQLIRPATLKDGRIAAEHVAPLEETPAPATYTAEEAADRARQAKAMRDTAEVDELNYSVLSALEIVEAREELLEGAGAAWDESKHSRYARGTPVRGREGGGRFAPKAISAPREPGWFALGDPVTIEGEVYIVDDVKVLPTGNRIYTLRDSAGNLRKIASTHPGLSRFDLPTPPEAVPAPVPAPEPAAPEAPSVNPDDELIEVTGRSLRPGDKFTNHRGQEFMVVEAGGGGLSGGRITRFVRVKNLETGQTQIMRASQKVKVRAGDHPAAARRLRKPPTRAVEGELGKVFSSTPAAKNPISVGANVASRELGNVLTLPDNVPQMPLKETRSQTAGAYFSHSAVTMQPIGMSVRKGDPDDIARMPSNIHHETGHYIDISVLGKQEGYASHVRDPEVAGPVMAAIDNSEAVRRIDAMRDDTKRGSRSRQDTQYGIVMNAGDPYEKRYAPDYTHLSYLSSSHEKFARAFEQYVSTKNGARLDDYRRGAALPIDHYDYRGPSESRSEGTEPDSRAFYGWYWQPEDFAPISAAFDEMFGRLGWSKK